MRKIYFILFTIFLVQALHAQPTRYGNEWIDYTPGHKYYKIRVTADGLYHLPYSVLSATIPNLSSINPADFVLFHNGTTVPIYIDSGSHSSIDTLGYIEFYGKKNVGDVDSVLFPQPGYQPHTLYSLFNDTSIYFLTTRTGGNNNHYQLIANDTASIPSLTEEEYYWYDAIWYYAPGFGNTFTAGQPFANGTDYLYKALYDLDEGWGSHWINFGAPPLSINISTPLIYTTGPAATVNVNMFTRSYEPHDIHITYNGSTFQDIIFDQSSGGPCEHIVTQSMPLTGLLASNNFKISEIDNRSVSTEANVFMKADILYPHKYDFGGLTAFYWQMKAGTGERYFRASNLATTATQPLLYDITNGYIIRSSDPPATLPKKFVLPASAGDRELYLRTDAPSTLKTITHMDTITFQDYTSAAMQSDYIIITHTSLRHDSLNHDYVQDYANYRDMNVSPNTGKFHPYIYDVDQLIDQFGYGVRKTPLATRNFIEYAYDHWTKKPQYLFLIGKGRDYKESRETAYAYNQNMIMPFGRYPSDNLLACRRGSNRPLVAVGRLAAQHPYDVSNYLNKMKTYEQQQATFGDPHQTRSEKLWMKQIMHFSGGSDANEQATFAQYLGGFAGISQDTSWGANTFTIYKTSSAPVDNSEADLIRAHIDTGVSLMTFFGHAAGTTFDISVDDPTNFTNYGKYPVMYSNGCQSGDLSSSNSTTTPPLPSYSESAVLVPNKCAIAFTATSSLATSNELNDYGVFLYQQACQYGYDRSWGKALQQTQIDMDSIYGNSDFDMLVAYEMTLHGDPALTLNQYTKPDYEIDQSSLYFTPAVVDASVDTFTANIIVTNLGKAIKDSIQITLSRTYPNPSCPGCPPITKQYKWKVRATYYIDTFSIRIPTFLGLDSGFGQNQFSVFVESEQRIPELSETNNGNAPGLQYSLFIQSEDILPIYPYEFAIVPTQNIQLKASTVDPFAKLQTYRIQIDTSELFHHPLAQSTITQTGGVLHWTVPITFHDSTVYYWRVSRDSINDTLSFNWHYSSFVYIKNEYPGWNQSHYYQYGHDTYHNNVYLDKDRVFKFVPNVVDDIHVRTGVADAVGGLLPSGNLEWDLHGVPQKTYDQGGCGFANPALNGGLTIVAIDTLTGAIMQSIWSNGNADTFDAFHCTQFSGTPINGFDVNVNSHGFDSVIQHIINAIPNGYIIAIYSVNEVQYHAWATNYPASFNKIVGLGATGLLSLASGAHTPGPYIFFTIKGRPSASSQFVGSGWTTALNGYYNYSTSLWNKGSYQSPIIGPASKWGSFHFRWRPRENPTHDQQFVNIIGIPNNGIPVTLLTTSALDTAITFINAAQYPNIQLKMNVEDDSLHTPSQLYYWRVLYTKVPEAAINPAAHFFVQKDTLSLGDTLNVEVALENVTELSMDSMRTLYTLRGPGGVSTATIKSDSLRAFQTQILKFKQVINSSTLTGNDNLTIEANPLDALHQLEEYHFNNYAVINFSANGDKINPLLDVTFDGRRIMNNDLVSAKPDILISMKDENKTLALNDTSLAQVYIRYPGQTVPTLINYDNSILTFYPATGNIAKRNEARIEYKPTFLQDGTYDLLVRDKDRSGNYSSNSTNRYEGTSINGVYYDYKISFNIITKSMITNVLNYPNPFSTRTQFVFTLTGSEIPDYMKIQIMTITGKVVKEIQRSELGNIQIGVNKTSYYWDGRDEYGDKLANGVYFYRVITKIDDKNVDHMSSSQYGQFFNNTNIDKYFKNGFGKLVIMR